jgi:ribosomal protein S18 acetylase RimI-like enzyme
MILADAGLAKGDMNFLTRCGFAELAELRYLVCFEEEFPESCPEGPLEFEVYREESYDRLKRVVAATYEGTLDCPGLNGVQRVEDVLAGYRATGVFDPARWLLVRHQGVDVGCLLLADHPDQDNMELVYMGVVSGYRGRGWGSAIARYAQWLTRLAGRPKLVAAVDTANGPGVEMYAGAGFEVWDRRRVFWRVFDSGV